MNKNFKKHCATLFFISLIFTSSAQVKTKTFNQGIPTFLIPVKIGAAKIKTLNPPSEFYELKKKVKDEGVTVSKTRLPKFALPSLVDIHLLKEAAHKDSNGLSIYHFIIKAPDVLNLSVQFSEFVLSPNAVLSIYNQYELTDSIVSKENNENRTWRTRTYEGNVLNFVLKFPINELEKIKLKIGTVYYGYDNFQERFGSPGASESCNINVNCPLGAGWQGERNAIAIIQTPNGNASGVLVMNTCGKNIPYFLTAKHVLDQGGNPANWVFQFFYFSTDCNTNTGYREDVQFNGGVLKASYGPSDFALLQLSQTPPNNLGIHYAGWNRNNVLPFGGMTGIHHPNFDVMKISRSNNFISRSFSGAYANTHWEVVWLQGITAPGSSGSPLFDPNHRIIGQLHSGGSSCATPNAPDWYGSFDISWTGGGTNTTRLSNWLDPSNSGATTTNTTNISALWGIISGPPTLCTSEIYSIPNLPSGTTVSWSASPSGIVYFTNASGSQVTVTKLYNGTFDLTATVAGCGTTTKNAITSGLAIDGSYSTSYDGGGPLVKYLQEGYNYITEYSYVWAYVSGSPQWSLVDGTISSWNYNGYNLEFYLSPNDWVTFRATVTSGGCTSSQDYTFIAQPYSYYSLAPNPASSDLTIYVDDEKLKNQKIPKSPDQVIQQVIIMDKFGNMMIQQKYPQNTRKVTLNVSGLSSDMYVVRIYDGKKWTSIKFLKH